LAIADAFDAIRYSRPYKLPINVAEALEILRAQSGTAYDPNLVQLFIDNIDELERTAAKESAGMPELSFQKSLDTADHPNTDSSSTIKGSVFHDFPGQMIHFAEFCSTAAEQLELEEFLSIVSRRIGSLIPFSTCAFFLDDGEDHVKAAHVAGCFSETLIDYKLDLGKGISGWVAAHRRPMINTDAALDFQDQKDKFSLLKYTLAVPILHGEDCLGTISLYGENALSYSQSHLNALQAIAGFIAPPISEIRNRGSHSDDYIDPITQVHLMPYLMTIGPQLLASARDNSSPASLIYLEIKNIHRISRNYGTDTEDTILRMIANCIKPELRETDILVRFGNQVFLAFLPGVREDQAFGCAQRLKQQVKKQSLNLGDRNLSIECAAGCSSFPKDGATLFALLQSAQQNVRARSSKSGSGGNKVIGFSPRNY
jgi:diguanylate cyclase (GGDEF)-like protein